MLDVAGKLARGATPFGLFDPLKKVAGKIANAGKVVANAVGEAGVGHFLSKHKRASITGLHAAYIAASGAAAGVGCAETALVLCPAIVAVTVAADKYAEGISFKGSYLAPED